MPGFALICLRTSSIIPYAALPTDFIVNAENAYGNIAPNNNDVNIIGSSNDICPCVNEPNIYELCINAPYNANPTNVADPIANPFPMAAVVLPAASNTSVLCLTYYGNYAISAIPPALSLIGP